MISQPIIGLHLDFKGVHFRPEYLTQLVADAASQGVNTLLVEYEDVFPFVNINIAADKATILSRAQIAAFLEEAKKYEIEVIPLQQSLGHLQYLLMRGYEEFSIPSMQANTLDISKPQARALMRDMLRQIIEAHPHSPHIMLGMDEANSLLDLAHEANRDVLEIFLEWLDELCAFCESHGKIPLIWDDMVIDHLSESSLPKLLAFKDRVVLVAWDYSSRGEETFRARIGGWRISREWLDEPDNPAAPAVAANQKFLEDLPPFARDLIAPERRGRAMRTLFQADLWTRLGFQVIGASAARQNFDGAIMPHFNTISANIHAWSRACERCELRGQITTAWARGNTFGAPMFPFDLVWPMVAETARSMGATPAPFFDGIDEETVARIVKTLGRCREDWRIAGEIADTMKRLAPSLRAHHYEWRSLMLMARVLDIHHRCDLARAQTLNVVHLGPQWVERFVALRAELDVMQPEVAAHFAARYHGVAFEEWLDSVFDPPRRWLARRGA